MHLVTGGAGFIGSHLVDALVENGQKVRVLDNFSSGREEFLSHHEDSGLVEIFRADLLDMNAVKKSMEGVEMVHHLAANPDIRLGTEVQILTSNRELSPHTMSWRQCVWKGYQEFHSPPLQQSMERQSRCPLQRLMDL